VSLLRHNKDEVQDSMMLCDMLRQTIPDTTCGVLKSLVTGGWQLQNSAYIYMMNN